MFKTIKRNKVHIEAASDFQIVLYERMELKLKSYLIT